MPIAVTYAELDKRLAEVRPWATQIVPDQNRCTICMCYVLRTYADGSGKEATLAQLPGAADQIKSVAAKGVATQMFTPTFADSFMVRGAELLPKVISKHGKPDIEGISKIVWPRVNNQRGVVYLEDCYATKGDVTQGLVLSTLMDVGSPVPTLTVPDRVTPSTGDHWDLFDGTLLVTEKVPLANNSHTGTLYFWRAR